MTAPFFHGVAFLRYKDDKPSGATMNKRQFLTTAALSATALPSFAARSAKPAAGPTLLTISGAIGRSNRGPLDPALDQMMAKQHIQFDKAFALDFAMLSAMPASTIKPTLEYDGKPHMLSGPPLADVLLQLGAPRADATTVLLRAIDGYAVKPTLADIRRYRFILATHLDGKPMPLGGLGPVWAVYDADRMPELATRPLNERFGLCPWGTYHIDIQPA
jgi:hypothetical protein